MARVQELDLYLRQQWTDERLAYEVDVREGVLEIAVPPDRGVWTPDTVSGCAHSSPHNAARLL